MREIVFDTETTGLDPYKGDRLVEIGCVELVNRFPTGRTFHRYVNPERDMPAEAFAVHGLSNDFLRPQPLFAAIVDELLAFIGEAALIAHNAMFDLGFLNAELERVKQAAIPRDRIVDTLLLARRKFPGTSNRLDDLCARFGIDNSRRTKHGALLDAELLAEVYVELVEARQAKLGLVAMPTGPVAASRSVMVAKIRPVPLLSRITDAERAAHGALIATLGDKAIWHDYMTANTSPERSAASGGA
jgi:DNA polymerase III subunit epsilon